MAGDRAAGAGRESRPLQGRPRWPCRTLARSPRGTAAFASAPIGYGADWAVAADGRTVLVEVNDGFSLGNYGVPGHLYTALLQCRWRQLNGLPDDGVGREPKAG